MRYLVSFLLLMGVAHARDYCTMIGDRFDYEVERIGTQMIVKVYSKGEFGQRAIFHGVINDPGGVPAPFWNVRTRTTRGSTIKGSIFRGQFMVIHRFRDGGRDTNTCDY